MLGGLAALLLLGAQTQAKLVQVQVVHRHGDRVPSVGWQIPKQPIDWAAPSPQGLGLTLGQLTGLGMTQSYGLGSWLRDTYVTNGKLLKNDFWAEDVSVYSTNVDRTLMTAQCVLMGLFPNGTSKAAFNEVTSQYALPTGAQPIPIHTQDKWDYLFQAVDICPEYDIRLQALYQSAEWKAKDTELKPFWDWFRPATGFSWANLPDFYSFYDPILVAKMHNRLDKITDVKNRFAEIQAVVDWVEWKKKSIGGKLIAAPLLGNIYVESERMMTGGGPGQPKRKFVQYSAHDSTLMALGVTAGWDSNTKFRSIASYTSAFLIELYNDTSKSGPSAWSVEVKFREGLTGEVTSVASFANWNDWLAFITNHTYPNTASWCLACNNTGVGGGYPGAGPCYRVLEYFNESSYIPDPDWTPPVTESPTRAASGAPTPEPTHEPTKAGDTAHPTMPPTPGTAPSQPPSSKPPSPATDTKVLEEKLAASEDQLTQAKATVGSQNTLIIILSVILGGAVLVAIFLALKLRQAKATNLSGMAPYQAVN